MCRAHAARNVKRVIRTLTRRQLIGDIVVGVLVLLMSLPVTNAFGRVSMFGDTPLTVTGSYLSIVVLAAAAAMRRLSPSLALILAWAGAVLQMSFGRMPSFEDVAILIVLYATAAYGSARTMWWGAASAGGGSVIAALYMLAVSYAGTATAPDNGVFAAVFVGTLYLIACLGSMGLSWASGLLRRTRLRTRRIEKERAIAEALAVAEAQRTQIARDMHDVVAHSLAVVIAQADGARYAAAVDPDAAPEALKTIATTARAALSDVRLLLTQLRHSQAEGPQPTLADLEELYAQVRAAGVDLRVDIDPTPQSDPPAAVQLAVYRILQEALTNAMRHGSDDRVDVFFHWRPDRVDLGVYNDAAATATVSGGGHGLVGMRERAQLVGGRLDAGPDGGRFVVRASLPIAQEDE